MNEVNNYKKEIIKMVEKINNQKFLKRIYISLKEFLKTREKPE